MRKVIVFDGNRRRGGKDDPPNDRRYYECECGSMDWLLILAPDCDDDGDRHIAGLECPGCGLEVMFEEWADDPDNEGLSVEFVSEVDLD